MGSRVDVRYPSKGTKDQSIKKHAYMFHRIEVFQRDRDVETLPRQIQVLSALNAPFLTLQQTGECRLPKVFGS